MDKYKYIYGPVFSWRLGRSLGIDLLGPVKRCNFDCSYCQLGRKRSYSLRRRNFVSVDAVVGELKKMPQVGVDYLTFSGMGEPTLAKNLGLMVRAIRAIRPEPIAILTNATLLGDKTVRIDLAGVDLVIAKLDAPKEPLFRMINKPHGKIEFADILRNITVFKKSFKGRFALQMMFTKKTKKHARAMADIARQIAPDEIHLNTPTRPPRDGFLSKSEMRSIATCFKGLVVSSVYDSARKNIKPIDAFGVAKRRAGAY